MSIPPSARHRWYTRPETPPLQLRRQPRLASWDAAASRSQHELAAYLADTEDLLTPQLPNLVGPWSLRLDVGIPKNRELLEAADLDNYVYPLTKYLTRPGGPAPPNLVSVWCLKRHAETSHIRAAPATPATPGQGPAFSTRTTASASTTGYKEQVHQAVRSATELAEGPVRVEISYIIGNRNWINLWKPTIDALDPLLGRTIPTRSWHPRDGRITELGMHLYIGPHLAYDVELCILAERIQASGELGSHDRDCLDDDLS